VKERIGRSAAVTTKSADSNTDSTPVDAGNHERPDAWDSPSHRRLRTAL